MELVSEQHCIDEGGDKISLLPDCILHHIFSFLSTKDVVATCSVAKRWQYLWNSVPNLDFDDWILYSSQNIGQPQDITSFIDFAERVLRQRDMSSLKRFRLSCRVSFSASHVNDWGATAISKHKAQNLDLCRVDEPFMLPCCVFQSQFIKVLKLEINCALMLPPNISFPCLQTLHLCLVTFPSDKSMQMLFSSCPVLQELALLDCEWVNLRSISISLPSLKILIIDDFPYCSVDGLRGCEIKIDCGNLLIFKYIGSLTNDVIVHGLSSSASAFIHVSFKCAIKVKEITGRTAKLFKGLKNVNSLRISGGTIESLLIADNRLDCLPKFKNLITLELRLEFENLPSYRLIKFLQCLPMLEFLHLHKGENKDQIENIDFLQGHNCQKPSSVLNIFSSLKRVNYHNFDSDTEIWLLKFVLEHARVLEQMKLFWSASSSLDPENQEKIIDHLLAVPRGSDHCALTFA